jgi:hypothetical protein
MSEQATDHLPEPARADANPAGNPPDTPHPEVTPPLRDQARLAWLFRHEAGDADARYLHDLVARFRGLNPW